MRAAAARLCTVLAAAAVLAGGRTAPGGLLSPERQKAVLREALSAYDRGVALARSDAAGSQRQFRTAILGFETLLDSGVRNAALEYNLGNAYFRAGDLGRSILHYLRARRLDPGHTRLNANLEYVRRQVEPLIPASAQRRLVERLMFWTNLVSLRQRFWMAVLGSTAGWALLAVVSRRRSGTLLGTGCVLAGLGAANAASCVWQLHQEATSPPAVVVAGGQLLRTGRGEAYEPVLRETLGAGVEVRVLEHRGGWVEVRLANDVTGWLPESAIEVVWPPPRPGALVTGAQSG